MKTNYTNFRGTRFGFLYTVTIEKRKRNIYVVSRQFG